MHKPERETQSTTSGAVSDGRSGHPTTLASRRSRRRQAGDPYVFLRGFLAHPHQVGSIVPSSPALERRLVRAGGLEEARSVVELGPGTGGTTRAFLRALRHDARLLAIELSPMFHARLRDRNRDPRLRLQLGSAEALGEALHLWRMPPPDAIFSGIPFSTLGADVAQRCAASIGACLAPGGRFVAYQVRAHVVDYMRPHLGEPETAWEWLNVPPLRVYRWVKPAR